MLQNETLLAKLCADVAENGPTNFTNSGKIGRSRARAASSSISLITILLRVADSQVGADGKTVQGAADVYLVLADRIDGVHRYLEIVIIKTAKIDFVAIRKSK